MEFALINALRITKSMYLQLRHAKIKLFANLKDNSEIQMIINAMIALRDVKLAQISKNAIYVFLPNINCRIVVFVLMSVLAMVLISMMKPKNVIKLAMSPNNLTNL